MADTGLPWSIPNAGFSIQPVNGEFAAWSRGSSVPPDGWTALTGTWSSSMSRCQGGTGPYAVDFGSSGIPSSLVSDYIVVLPNTRYLLSALRRIVTGSGAALSQGVRVDWYDDTRTIISSNNLDLIANTAGVWTYSGLDITSPIKAVYAKVVVGRFNVNGSTDIQVDAIKLDRAVYIPSGVISLDDVTDGVTYARPKGAYMTAGIINAVVRGAGTVGTDFLFKKPNIADPDTLDGVPDSVTYGKVKNTMLTAGEVTSLSRGGSVYATSTFFQKALDNLDNIVDGSSFRKVGTGYVDASNRITGILRGTSAIPGTDIFVKPLDTLDNITDGTVNGKVKNTMLTGGEITSLSRGGTVYATTTFFQKALDNLDNVVDGTSFRKVGTAYVDSSNRITNILRGTSPLAGADIFAKTLDTLDNVTDGSSFRKVGTSYVDASNRIVAIRNTSGLGADIPGTAVFSKSVDTLDNVTDGASFRKVSTSYVDASNRISSVFNGTSAVAGSNLFNKAVDTLDNVSNGTSFARVSASTIDSGVVSSIRYGAGVTVNTVNLFRKGTDTLDSVVDSASFRKVSATYINPSNQITVVRRAGSDESVDNLFKKSSDTFASVAGTLSDGQLGTNVVNTSNIKDGNITGVKVADYTLTGNEFADGPAFRAYDEGDGTVLRARANTYVNIDTVDVTSNQYASTFSITASAPASYLTGFSFYNNTSIGPYAPHVVFRYKTGSGTWPATSTGRISTVINSVTYTSTFTIYGDGVWHTVFADVSAWGSTNVFASSQIKMEFPFSGTNPSAGAKFQMGYFATGIANGGSANGIMTSVGNVGVGSMPSGYGKLEVTPTSGQRLAIASNGAGAESGSTGLLSHNGAGVYVPNASVASAFSWYRTGNLLSMKLDSSGNFGVGTTPGNKLHVLTGDVDGIRVESSNSGYLEVGQTSGQRWRWANNYSVSPALELLTGASGAAPATSLMTVTAAGNFGIKTTSPARELSVKGQVTISPSGTGDDTAYNGQLIITKPSTAGQHINMIRAGNHVRSIGFKPSTNTFLIAGGETTDSNFGNSIPFSIDAAGGVGCNTTTPVGGNTRLTVAGDITFTSGYGVLGNSYYSGASFYYAATGAATALSVGSGQFSLQTAPSGTGGNAATFTARLVTTTTASTFTGHVYPNANNTYTLGSSGQAWADVWCNRGAFNGSDARIKNTIEDCDRGLAFIEALRPRKYRLNVGSVKVTEGEDGRDKFEGVPGKRPHYGFVAQEVKEAVDADGLGDFAGYAYAAESDSHWLTYEEFISPLVKAVQELSAKVKRIEAAQL